MNTLSIFPLGHPPPQQHYWEGGTGPLFSRDPLISSSSCSLLLSSEHQENLGLVWEKLFLQVSLRHTLFFPVIFNNLGFWNIRARSHMSYFCFPLLNVSLGAVSSELVKGLLKGETRRSGKEKRQQEEIPQRDVSKYYSDRENIFFLSSPPVCISMPCMW